MTFSTQSSSQPVVMQIIPELSAGGAEQGCIDVGVELIAGGAQSIIVSNGGNRLHELERHGITHINMPVHSKNPITMRRNARKIAKLIEQYGVHIVHVRSRAPAWSAYWACQKSKMPVRFMTTCHAPYNISGEWKRKYNAIMTRGERVIAISEMVTNYLTENYHIDPSIIRLIPRGIAIEKFHPTAVTPQRLIELSNKWRIPDGANIIMLPGRLTRWKGHHVLIDAMAKIGRKDLFAVIIGDDQGRSEYRKELEDSIETKGLSEQIRIVSHCNDMPAAYMLATVVVSASIEPEGFGRIPVEAQAMGRPIIGTAHGGALETIKAGQTGWLVEPGDPIALSRAIEDALDLNQGQRAMLATRAMAHVVDHFTKEQMLNKTMNVYAELLRGQILSPPERPDPFHLKKSA